MRITKLCGTQQPTRGDADAHVVHGAHEERLTVTLLLPFSLALLLHTTALCYSPPLLFDVLKQRTAAEVGELRTARHEDKPVVIPSTVGGCPTVIDEHSWRVPNSH